MSKTWKKKIGKRLTAHVKESTQRCTLAEFWENRKAQAASGSHCWQCQKIEWILKGRP